MNGKSARLMIIDDMMFDAVLLGALNLKNLGLSIGSLPGFVNQAAKCAQLQVDHERAMKQLLEPVPELEKIPKRTSWSGRPQHKRGPTWAA